jgi:hypothetical protein
MDNLESTLHSVIAAVARDNAQELEAVHGDTNLMEYFDSLALLNIVIGTEAELESALGRYVMLAGESLMDAHASPFLRFDTWVDYVKRAIEQE